MPLHIQSIFKATKSASSMLKISLPSSTKLFFFLYLLAEKNDFTSFVSYKKKSTAKENRRDPQDKSSLYLLF